MQNFSFMTVLFNGVRYVPRVLKTLRYEVATDNYIHYFVFYFGADKDLYGGVVNLTKGYHKFWEEFESTK